VRVGGGAAQSTLAWVCREREREREREETREGRRVGGSNTTEPRRGRRRREGKKGEQRTQRGKARKQGGTPRLGATGKQERKLVSLASLGD